MRRHCVLFACSLLLAGCATALKEPPSLTAITGPAGDLGPDDVDRLLAAAELLWAEREAASVREALAIWLRAAAADTARVEGLIGAVNARVWLAGHTAEAEREAAAKAAVQTAQWCRRLAPDEPACAYGLAIAVGVQAREQRATAIDALPEMIDILEQVIEADPALDHGGPHRVLALVYARAPGWPAGPGDPERGLEHARTAVILDPGYPPNHLALAETLDGVKNPEAAREAYREAETLATQWIAAGDPDAPAWLEQALDGLSGRR